jgi:predicted transcriptional regulator
LERLNLVSRLCREGQSQRMIADNLGISKTTVARYWPAQKGRARAA